MITKLFKKTKKDKDKDKEIIDGNNLTKITALLIHAAKIDDNYSQKEKGILDSKNKPSYINGKKKYL